MATEIVVPIRIESGNSPKTIKDLRQESNRLRDSLVSLERGSNDYNKALQQLSNTQGKLNQINQESRAVSLNFEQQLNNLVRISGSVVSGYSAVVSATALLGSENEQLTNTLVRVQSAMSFFLSVKGLAGLQNTIPQLLTGIRNFTFGLNGLQKAILSTGIGALVVAVGALAANWDRLTGSARRYEEEQKRLNRIIDDAKVSFTEFNNELSLNSRLLQAQGATANEVLQNELETLQRKEEDIQSTLRALLQGTAGQIENNKDLIAEYRSELEYLQESIQRVSGNILVQDATDARKQNDDLIKEQNRLSKIREDELREIVDINRRIENQNLSSYEIQIRDLEDRFNRERDLYLRNNKEITDLQIQYYTDLDEIVNSELNRVNQIEYEKGIERISNINQINDEAINQQRIYLAELQTLLLEAQASGGSVEEIEQMISEQMSLYSQNQLLFLENYRLNLEELLSDLTLNSEQRIELETELQNTLNEISILGFEERSRIARQEIDAYKAQQKAEDEIDKERIRGKQSLLGSLSNISNQASQIIGQETAAGKALAIAGATIDTYRAGVSAFASTPGGPIIKGAALASTVATGLATVVKIAKVNVPGSSSSADVSEPEINYEDVFDEPIERTTNVRTSTEEQELNSRSDNRVYVTETDISDAIRRVDVVENQSTF